MPSVLKTPMTQKETAAHLEEAGEGALTQLLQLRHLSGRPVEHERAVVYLPPLARRQLEQLLGFFQLGLYQFVHLYNKDA